MDPMSCRIPRWLILPLFLSLPLGCSLFSGDTTSSTAVAPSPPPAAAPAPTAAAPPNATSADDLAAKVTDYRNDVEPRLSRDQAKPVAVADAPATQPATPAIGDSNWFTADSMRLTTYKQDAPAAPVAAPKPSDMPLTQANPAAVAAGNVGFPVSIPEGADQTPVAGTGAVNASAIESPTFTADQVEHKLAQQLRDYPQDLEGQLDYELLMFIEGQPVPQMSAMSNMRAEDRELLSAVMDGMSNFRSVIRSDTNQLLAAKTQPLIDMADRLRSQSELTLPTVALCTSVTSYGLYTPIDKARFPAGADNKVVVYCEVQNFQSRLSPDNQWQTQLSEEMVLYTETGLPVWPAKSLPQRVTDICRQKRHDFCFAKLVTLPANLTIGRYLLKITVTDMQANHVAESTTPIEIVAE
jgi:hypothetical protein